MSTGQKFLSGIILGVVVGATIILLSKTDKGQDILSDLQDAADDAKDKFSDAKDSFKDKYSSLEKEFKSLIKKGKAFIEDLEDKAKDIAG